MRKIILIVIIILLTSTCFANCQENINPISLELRVYSDGSVLIEYTVEGEPAEVRIDVELFGENYNNLIIRDEEDNPLDYSKNPTGVTVDSIGASEITLIYYSFDFTRKDGPLWDLNISSPISTGIFLPEGTAIFDLSDIPLDLQAIDNTQYVLLPQGEVYVSYTLSIPNLNEEAMTALETSDEYITSLEEQGLILIDARAEYEAANTLYQSNQFSEAKDKALQAQETADETRSSAESAMQEISLAQSAVDQATIQGKTIGLESAEEALSRANEYYSKGLYNEAEASANQANQLVLNADTAEKNGNILIYISALILVAVVIGGYIYLNSKKSKDDTKQVLSRKYIAQINTGKIFDEYETLRLEDREVIKFLAENGGEVFATEIRERFDMPRSTTWRLIRRLKALEIVEEVKIGNQSLVRVKEEYHE